MYGNIRDSEGKALENVIVKLYRKRRSGFEENLYSELSNEQGNFIFTGLINGDYKVSFQKNGSETLEYYGNVETLSEGDEINIIATDERQIDFQFSLAQPVLPKPIPTLSEWSLMLLILSLLIISLNLSRNHRYLS